MSQHCVALYPVPGVPAQQSLAIGPVVIFETREMMERPLAFTPCWSGAVPKAPPGSKLPPLTIIARPSGREYGIVQSVLASYGVTGSAADFRLIRSPTRADGRCTALRLGSSGRGVRAEADGAVYRCIASQMLSPFGVIDSTVDFYPNTKICDLPGADRVAPVLDFDEGRGRLICGDGLVITIMDF